MRSVLLVFVALFASLYVTACAGPRAGRDVLFQVSTIDAVLDGVFDGAMTLAELRRHGDTGIGTFHSLDGELVCVDGTIHQVRGDGRVYEVSDDLTTPFAAITWLDPDRTAEVKDVANLAALEAALDGMLTTPNAFYALRIDGEFEYVKTRSVPAQSKPYPPLAEVAKQQPTFEFQSVMGTLVGFRCPEYVKGVNVPGYHLHFLDDARTGGGHLLECRIKRAMVQVDYTDCLHMVLPCTEGFAGAELGRDRTKELHQAER